MAVRRAVATLAPGAVPEAPKVIRTLAELDQMIEGLEAAARQSDDELRRGFRSFRMEPPAALPGDPFSADYRRAVMDLYEWLRGSSYTTESEVTPIDAQAAAVRPFPYLTGSAVTVGDYLIGVGHLIRTIGLGPGSRVLEMGPGWGSVAVPLAQLGCDVTVVEISPHFVEVVRARAAQVGTEVRAVEGDFSVIDSWPAEDARFDAVVFFESFHHSADHLRLLASVDRVVARGGRVVFGAEPIDARFWSPWGPRLDGESLWAIRRNGWLELGFRRDYFLEALRRTGWRAQPVSCAGSPWGQAWVAGRM